MNNKEYIILSLALIIFVSQEICIIFFLKKFVLSLVFFYIKRADIETCSSNEGGVNALNPLGSLTTLDAVLKIVDHHNTLLGRSCLRVENVEISESHFCSSERLQTHQVQRSVGKVGTLILNTLNPNIYINLKQ